MNRFVLLFVVTVFVSKLSLDVAYAGSSKLSQSFKTFFRPLLHARQKRQSSNACLDDFGKLQGEDYQTCLGLFGEMTSLSSLAKYCSSGCSDKLVPLFEALLKDCGSAGGISSEQVDFLKDACLQNAKHVYCIVAAANGTHWVKSSSPYQNCVNAGATNCNSDCQKVMRIIVNITGCCEFEMEKLLDQVSPSDKSILDNLWSTCNVTKPAQCQSFNR